MFRCFFSFSPAFYSAEQELQAPQTAQITATTKELETAENTDGRTLLAPVAAKQEQIL
jgi:hypothetical protein